MNRSRTYKESWTAKGESWTDFEQSFILSFKGIGDEMIELIEYVSTSNYHQRIFAISSHLKIIVSNIQEIDTLKDCLHVEFDKSTNEWVFEYFSGPFYGSTQNEPEISKKYPKELGKKKFDKFISVLKW